ncbi:MAG TPA: glycosyltransferase family A protein [Acidimicrobiales bacterium]|nr:glycosyltransferase family A protein [Acidimicrobiales bacterium]
MTAAPRVSVVCSTYDRAPLVARLLRTLADQTLPADELEVVVVDNGSTDDTATVLERLAHEVPFRLRTLRHARNRGAAGGRNTGWRAAAAPVVAFTDDDCAPEREWLERGLAALEGVGPRTFAVGRTRPDPDEEAWLRRPFSRSMSVEEPRFYETCNVFYRRDDLEALGGFDEGFGIGGEDTDLALRLLDAGGQAVWVPEAVVRHQVRPPSFRANLREARRWVDLPRVVGRHPGRRGELVHRRWFWKRAHPPTVLALAGMAAAAGRRSPVPLVAATWWLWHRLATEPACPGPRRRVLALPGTFAIDATEVATMVRGSVRHRTVLL